MFDLKKVIALTTKLNMLSNVYGDLSYTQKIDLIALSDRIDGFNCEYFNDNCLSDVECALMQAGCDNETILKKFMHIGDRAHFNHVRNNDLVISVSGCDVNVWNINNDPFSSHAGCYSYYMIKNLIKFDFLHGLDSLNIPQWIKDLPLDGRILEFNTNYFTKDLIFAHVWSKCLYIIDKMGCKSAWGANYKYDLLMINKLTGATFNSRVFSHQGGLCIQNISNDVNVKRKRNFKEQCFEMACAVQYYLNEQKAKQTA